MDETLDSLAPLANTWEPRIHSHCGVEVYLKVQCTEKTQLEKGMGFIINLTGVKST